MIQKYYARAFNSTHKMGFYLWFLWTLARRWEM